MVVTAGSEVAGRPSAGGGVFDRIEVRARPTVQLFRVRISTTRGYEPEDCWVAAADLRARLGKRPSWAEIPTKKSN